MTVFLSVRAERRIDYIPLRYFRYGIHILDYTLQTHCFYIVHTFTAMVNGLYMPLCIRVEWSACDRTYPRASC